MHAATSSFAQSWCIAVHAVGWHEEARSLCLCECLHVDLHHGLDVDVSCCGVEMLKISVCMLVVSVCIDKDGIEACHLL